MSTTPVRLWLIRTDRDAHPNRDSDVDALREVLDTTELKRAAALRHPPDRRRFVIAHAARRLILAQMLGVAPADLRWATGPQGKPELMGLTSPNNPPQDHPPQGRPPQVNLSHSADLSVVAIHPTRAVGVDIQQIRTDLNLLGLANRFFTPDEARHISEAADKRRQAERFTQLWTRKEAVVKAAGGRIWPALRLPVRGDITRLADHDYRIVDVPPQTGMPPRTGGKAATGFLAADTPSLAVEFRMAVALAGVEPYPVEVSGWEPNIATDR